MCDRYNKLDWTDFLKKEVSDSKRDEMDSHRLSCPSCKKMLLLLRTIQETGRKWYEEDMPSLSDDKKETILKEIQGKSTVSASSSSQSDNKKTIITSWKMQEWIQSAAAAFVVYLLSLASLYLWGQGLLGFDKSYKSPRSIQISSNRLQNVSNGKNGDPSGSMNRTSPFDFYRQKHRSDENSFKKNRKGETGSTRSIHQNKFSMLRERDNFSESTYGKKQGVRRSRCPKAHRRG